MTRRMHGPDRIDSNMLQAIWENAVDAIIAIDEQGTIEMINPATVRLFGYRVDELLGRNVTTLMPEPFRSEHHRYLNDYLATGKRKIIGIGREVEAQRKDGSIFPCHLSVAEVKDGDRRIFAGFLRDLSERQEAARELRHVRSYLENIVDSMPSILVGVDPQGYVTEWNRSAEQMTGVPARDAQGRCFVELLPQLSEHVDMVGHALDDGQSVHAERLVTETDGEIRYSDVMVYPLVANGAIGAVIRVDDITKRIRLEQMMVQTEKMMSVGGLAAGMAHEINNPLSAVLQACQNILRRLSPDLAANRSAAEELGVNLPNVRAYLERRGILQFLEGIQEAANRATRIVVDMLAFSRRSDAELAPTRVEEMLDVVIRLATSDYDLKRNYDFRQIQIVRDYDENLGEIYCDQTEMEQVFLNLVKNAAQAMSEAGTPPPQRIILRSRHKGRFAEIEVEDNGPGMNAQTRRRIFEPFFTTKKQGVGTGLGLSVSYFIVTEQHGGTIRVSSTPGKGTRFTIRLPLGNREGRR